MFKKLSAFAYIGILSTNCGIEDKVKEAEASLTELDELSSELGVEGVEQSDVELALSEMFDEDLSDESGESISMSDTDFENIGDQLSSEIDDSKELSAEEESEDPTVRMRKKAMLDRTVDKVFEVADTDKDSFLTEAEWTSADFVGAGAKFPKMRTDLFSAANLYCAEKDEDTESLYSEEVRCIVRRVIAHKVKKHYAGMKKEERLEKRNTKRSDRMKKVRKDKLGIGEGERLTEEQKRQLQEKFGQRKSEFDKRKSEFDKIKSEKATDPDAFRQRIEDRKAQLPQL